MTGDHPTTDLRATATDLGAVLRVLAEALPPGSAVPVPREWLLQLLEGPERNESGGASGTGHDYTTGEAAELLRLSANRVRALIAAGELDAYRVAGCGDWRVTQEALAAFRAAGKPLGRVRATLPAERADLSRWRRVRRGGAGSVNDGG
jgi:excisionase family DNA binding protein